LISYEDWLQEIVPINKQYTLPRVEYYKRFMPSLNPKEAYEQQVKVMKYNKENGVYVDTSQRSLT